MIRAVHRRWMSESLPLAVPLGDRPGSPCWVVGRAQRLQARGGDLVVDATAVLRAVTTQMVSECRPVLTSTAS